MKLYDKNTPKTALYTLLLPVLMFAPIITKSAFPTSAAHKVGEGDIGLVIVIIANFLLVPLGFAVLTIIFGIIKVQRASTVALWVTTAGTLLSCGYVVFMHF